MVALNFDRGRPEAMLNLNEVARAARLVARERLAAARLGPHLRRDRARRAARRPAGARRGVAHRRLAADPQPRHDRRQPRHRVACRRRAAAARRRGRGGRVRVGARHAPRPAARLRHRRQAQRARARRADHRRLADAVERAADVHEGRAAQRDGDRRRLARRLGGRRAARVVRLGLAAAGARHRAARRGRVVRGAGRRRRVADRRRARHRALPAACAPRARRARARSGCSHEDHACAINGEEHQADCWEGESLLFALREKLGFPGSKNACEQGECGSCSVLLDGTLVCACLVLAAQADGHEVTTVEGLADGDELHPVQQAFVEAGAVQCGFCTPGLVVATADLLQRTPQPVGRRDPRGALRQPLPLHRLRQDLRRGAARRGRA